MHDLLIGGTAVPAGARTIVRIPVAKLPTGTPIDLPVHVLRGVEDGPVLLLQGGLHGDELNGVEALRRLLADAACAPLRGTVLVVPVLNQLGFLHLQRDLPDGKDINRSFPGSRRGSLASRVAHAHMEHVFAAATAAIDFHTGGGRRFNHPQVRYTAAMPASQQLADAFAAPYRLATKLIPKSFRHAASKRQVPVVVFEGGESLRFDGEAIRHAMEGALRVMRQLGMIDQAPDPGPSLHLDVAVWQRAPHAGLFAAQVVCGQVVDKGDLLGMITDPHNAHPRALTAKRAGHVVSINHLPVVHGGDALVRIGVPS